MHNAFSLQYSIMSYSRTYSQVDPTTGFFVALLDNSSDNPARLGFYPADLATALNNTSNVTTYNVQNLGSVINTNNAGQFIRTINNDNSVDYNIADQFRDLGKTLYVQTNAMNAYIYRLVERMESADTEGVPQNPDVFYTLVWAAKGRGNPKIKMLRTGY